MQDRGMCGGWAMLLVGSLGCGAGQDISLGSEAPLRSELEDAGAAPDPTWLEDAGAEPDPGWSYPALPEARRCAEEVDGELEIDFQLDLTTPVCPSDSGCQLDLDQIVPASDGSLWVRGARRVGGPLLGPGAEGTSYAWLAHVGADGTLLGTTEVEMGGSNAKRNADLAVDDRGEAWLATWEVGLTGYSHTAQIQRYDAAVSPIGTPTVLESWNKVRMANAPGRGILAAGLSTNRERLTALLDGDGVPRWTRTEGVVGLRSRPVIDPSGQLVVASAAPEGRPLNYFDDGVDRGPTSLQAYGPDGVPLWSRDLGRALSGTSLEWSNFALMNDSLGNLTVAALENDPVYSSTLWQTSVLRLTADGTPQWLWQLYGGFNQSVAVEPATGRTFLAAFPIDEGREGFNGGTLTEISADGETCRKYSYSGIYSMRSLAYSAAGELFFAANRSVGRLHPIGP